MVYQQSGTVSTRVNGLRTRTCLQPALSKNCLQCQYTQFVPPTHHKQLAFAHSLQSAQPVTIVTHIEAVTSPTPTLTCIPNCVFPIPGGPQNCGRVDILVCVITSLVELFCRSVPRSPRLLKPRHLAFGQSRRFLSTLVSVATSRQSMRYDPRALSPRRTFRIMSIALLPVGRPRPASWSLINVRTSFASRWVKPVSLDSSTGPTLLKLSAHIKPFAVNFARIAGLSPIDETSRGISTSSCQL